MKKRLKQGNIIYMNFDPTKGHEQEGYRPALVVSNDDYNEICKGKSFSLVVIGSTLIIPPHISL